MRMAGHGLPGGPVLLRGEGGGAAGGRRAGAVRRSADRLVGGRAVVSIVASRFAAAPGFAI